MDFLNNFELGILDFIRDNLSCSFLDKVMPVITSLADAGIFWIIVAVTRPQPDRNRPRPSVR